MSDVLNNIRQEIEKAVKKRERYKALVNGKVNVLKSLREKINDCIRRVSATSFENKSLYADKLRMTVEKIDQILKDAAPLINRFNRDTINLGVAGATQAGKSTFLEAVSGVDLPRAKGERSGDSTTAAKSIIINSPERKTTVFFRTKDEFVTNVKAYLPENQRSRVSDIDDFENLPLDEIMSTAKDSRERTEIKRLQEAQQSFRYIKHLLGSTQFINLADLADYVTYYQCKDEQHRFWPVVKLVEIRCPFDALNNSDIKLTLVDLPGMGESPRVSEQMVRELDHEVDTVLLLFKTTAVKPDDDAITFDAIKNAQKFVKDKTKFLSFLINVVANDDNREGNINSIKIRINDVFKRNSSENYVTYETSVLNSDKSHNRTKVHQDVVSVLTKLVGDIDELDSDTISGWMATLNEPVVELKKQVSNIANMIKDDLPISADEDEMLNNKTREIIDSLPKFNFLEEKYECYQPKIEEVQGNDEIVRKEVKGYVKSAKVKEISRVIVQAVEKISQSIEDSPLDKDDWKSFFSNRYEKNKAQALDGELTRLWTNIREKYMQLENVANGLLSNLKNEIITEFNKLVGNDVFISKQGDEGICELLNKVAEKEDSMPLITESFEHLQRERISFNQIVYPCIVKSRIAKAISNDSRTGGLVSNDSFNVPEGSTREELFEHVRKRLIHIVLDVNNQVKTLVCEETPIAIAAFLYSKIEHFNNTLNRSKADDDPDKFNCFHRFSKAFRLDLWPEVFGVSSAAVVAREIAKNLNEIITIANQLNK